jgi:hypothetical protein
MEPVAQQILLVARDDGLLISIDGACNYKHMTAKQYFELAVECQKAGLDILRRESNVARRAGHSEGGKKP